jgi:hypothetical protein
MLAEKLTAELMTAVYGKELAKTSAAKKLEEYVSYNRDWELDGSASIFDPVEDNCSEGAPWPFHASNIALSIFRDAMVRLDAKFFEDFAQAIQRRKDPAYADRFKVLDYIQERAFDLLFKKRGPIEYDELKGLGISNVSRTVTELNLESYIKIKTHTDRRGKMRKKNTN